MHDAVANEEQQHDARLSSLTSFAQDALRKNLAVKVAIVDRADDCLGLPDGHQVTVLGLPICSSTFVNN